VIDLRGQVAPSFGLYLDVGHRAHQIRFGSQNAIYIGACVKLSNATHVSTRWYVKNQLVAWFDDANIVLP
jgi:hypothetical protein